MTADQPGGINPRDAARLGSLRCGQPLRHTSIHRMTSLLRLRLPNGQTSSIGATAPRPSFMAQDIVEGQLDPSPMQALAEAMERLGLLGEGRFSAGCPLRVFFAELAKGWSRWPLKG